MIRKREREREREFVCMRGRAKKLSFVKFPREMFDRTTTRLTRKWNLFDRFQLYWWGPMGPGQCPFIPNILQVTMYAIVP